MRVLLVNPRSNFLISPMVFAPLGLWFVGAAVRKAGHEVDFIDLNEEKEVPLGYDAYLVTGTTPQLRSMQEVAKRVGRGPITIAGGPHATLQPADLLKAGFRYAVGGEGELIVNDILDGVYAEGVVNSVRITDPTLIPHPLRDWAGMYRYTLEKKRATHALLSRGCPFSCAFCCHALWSQLCVEQHIGWVKTELDAIVDQGYRAVMFYDDTFTLEEKRVEAIGKLLKERNLTWRAFGRADRITERMASLLAEYGCVEIGLGVESGSEAILHNIGKRTRPEDNTLAVERLRAVGVRTKAFMIVGLPGETEETAEETEHWLRSVRPDDYDVTIFVPYPGTPIWNKPQNYDVSWDGMEASLMWYKGVPGHYSSLVWTSGLSRQRIAEIRDRLEHMKGEINGSRTVVMAGGTKSKRRDSP